MSASVKLQHLTCAAGHNWVRPACRGTIPRFCPGHEPLPVTYARAWREARRREQASELRRLLVEAAEVAGLIK